MENEELSVYKIERCLEAHNIASVEQIRWLLKENERLSTEASNLTIVIAILRSGIKQLKKGIK